MSSEALRVDARRNVERVLDAAIHVLGQDPAASIEQVASASGVHRSTVYRRFPTRETLLTALVDRFADEGRDLVEAAASRAPSDATLRDLFAEMIEFGDRYAFLRNHDADPRYGRDPLGLVALFRAHQRAGVLRDDMSAAWLVTAFSALTVSLIHRRRSRPDRADESAHLLYETFLNGARSAPST